MRVSLTLLLSCLFMPSFVHSYFESVASHPLAIWIVSVLVFLVK